MAQQGKPLQVPQINRIRAEDPHTADALKLIADFTNKNVVPATGNKITPLNAQK